MLRGDRVAHTLATAVLSVGPSLSARRLIIAMEAAHVSDALLRKIMRKLTELPSGWVTLQRILEEAGKHVKAAGISAHAIGSMALKESEGVMYEGQIYLNPNVINFLGYRGLFQFDKKGDAWAVANATCGQSLPPFAEGWNNVEASVKAAMYYARHNFATFRNLTGYKGEATSELIYLCHNQGASGAAKIVNGAKISNKQSAAAIQTAMVATAQFEKSMSA